MAQNVPDPYTRAVQDTLLPRILTSYLGKSLLSQQLAVLAINPTANEWVNGETNSQLVSNFPSGTINTLIKTHAYINTVSIKILKCV